VEGQFVRAGELIARVRSTEVSGAQSGFLKARTQQTLQERAVERAKRLLDAGVIGEAELQRREAELAQVAAEVSSSRDELRVLGMSEEALKKLETSRILNSLFEIHATIDGTVLERKITIGQVVQSADPVCVLADLSKVWLVADMPEQAAGAVEVGKAVEADIPALPNAKITGRISWVSSTVNPETRTVRVRMDLPNAKHRFKPAMLATMLLKDTAEVKPVVPASAVVREGDETFVFVETAKGAYQLKAVQLGEEYDGQVVLVDGLTEKDRIVTAGAFHLNNERKRLAIQGS
jgi:cobalt-zinc-cadmium efflux system membrane fusion protein